MTTVATARKPEEIKIAFLIDASLAFGLAFGIARPPAAGTGCYHAAR
jgi:hypothetical protein